MTSFISATLWRGVIYCVQFQSKEKMFERVPFPEIPPRVEYRLTPFGKKFLRLLKEVERLQA